MPITPAYEIILLAKEILEMSKVALACAIAASMLMPIALSVSAQAQYKKCYHCYVTKYGKKICHNDCACQYSH